jgi:hypothetical protein
VDKVQTIRLVLADGREGLFTGEAICDPRAHEDLRVMQVFVSFPHDLPDGYEIHHIHAGPQDFFDGDEEVVVH